MKPSKQKPPKENPIKHALLGLYGIVGVSLSVFGGFKLPFAESNAKDYWRHALAGIIILLALITGIISLVLYMFDANYFKSQMVDYVKIHNHRDLTLDGDIKVKFFPKLGLDTGKLTLSQRDSNKNFASIDNARFYVAWWPLFIKQLQIEHADLDGVHANIIHYKNGGTNLDDLFTRDGSLNDVKFDIDSIQLKNSSVNFTDEPTSTLFTLHDMDIQTGRLTDSTPGNVSASFRLESVKPRIDTKVKLTSHILFELKTNHYEFANLEVEMEGESSGITNLALNFQGTINAFPALQKLTVDKLIANVKGKIENRKLDAKLDIPALQLNKSLFTGTAVTFNANLIQEDENITATIEIPAFELIDNKFQAKNISANFDLFKAGRTLQGKLNSPINFDFASMQLQLPNIVSSFSATHPLLSNKLNANLTGSMLTNFTEQKVKLDLKTKIDDSVLTGSAGFQDFNRPAYTFDVSVNKLDFDRYLVADWAKRFQDDALPFDFSAIKNLNLRGKLRSGELKLAKLKASSLITEVKADKSILSFEPFNAKLYGGTIQGSFSVSANDVPSITSQQKLNGIQLNSMLTDLFTGESKLVGKGNLAAELNASGANMAGMRKTLYGNVSLTLGRGSIAGINLTEALIEGKDHVGIKNSERTGVAKFTESTSFAELRSTFEFNNGKANTKDFLMKSALYTSKGEGSVILDSGQINFQINTSITANLKSSINKELAEIKGVNVPVLITGPYAAPSITLDFSNASGKPAAKPVKESSVQTTKPSAKKSKPGK